MKKIKAFYLVLGFVGGIAYLVACGGSNSSIAETLGNAADVVYDNLTSALSATNMQTAVDEVVDRIKALESNSSSVTTSAITGTWSGIEYYNKTAIENASMVFGANGAFSCSGGATLSALGTDSNMGLCGGSFTWSLKGHTILLTPTAGGNNYRIIQVSSVDSTNISLIFTMETATQFDFFYGTKQ